MPPLDPGIHKQIEKDRTTYLGEDIPSDIVSIYRDYLSGKHRPTLTTEAQTWLRGVLSNQFCDNVCHHITAEARDRIRFVRFECEDEKVSEFLGDFYIANRLAAIQNQIHYDSLGEGNTLVALGFENESNRVFLVQEDWWDGKSGVFVAYDDLGRITYAVKEWTEVDAQNNTSRKRRNIWLEDPEFCWMEMWVGNGATQWEPFDELVSIDGVEQLRGPVIPWMNKGEKMHIPYVHFPNTDRGSDVYGVSEIGGGVLGFQDQLNDIQYNLTAIGRNTAFQMYWGSGVKPKIVAGEEVPPNVGPGEFLYSIDPAARFGVLQAGDVQNMVILYRTKLQSVARMTRTPLHIITGGDWPSGEALLRSELPAIGKAQGQIETFKNCWSQVAHRAVEIWNRFGKGDPGKLTEDIKTAQITTRFADPEKRDFVTKVTMAQMLKDIVSPQEKLRIMGYTDAEIDKIMGEMDEEKSKALDESLKKLEAEAKVRGQNDVGNTEVGNNSGE